MNKTELAAAVAGKLETSNVGGLAAVNAVLDTIRESLAEGAAVNLTGFGKFEVLETKARVGCNPRTGEAVAIPAKAVVKFRPGQALKAAIS